MADQEGKWEQLYEEEKAEKEQINQEHLEAEETWKELENELEKEIDDVTAEKDRLDSDCAALREKVEAERDKKNELSTQLNRVQTELQQLKSKGSNNSSKIQKLEQENDSLSQRDRITKASLSQLKEELETVQEEKFLLNQQMLESETEMKQKLREYEEKLVEAKGDAEVKDTLVHKLQTKINVMEALGEQLAIAKADHEKDSLIQKLKAEVQDSESLRAQLAKAKGELDAKDALIQKLRDQVKEAKQKLVQVQGHLELKQSLIQSMQSQVTGSDTISAQLAKATGEIENKNLLIRKLQSQVKDVEKLREELAVAIKKTLIQKFQAGVKALGNQLTKAKRDLKAKDSLVQKLQRSLGAQLANAKGELEAKNALIKKLKDEAAHETAHEREPSGDIPLSALPDVYKDEIAASKEKTERVRAWKLTNVGVYYSLYIVTRIGCGRVFVPLFYRYFECRRVAVIVPPCTPTPCPCSSLDKVERSFSFHLKTEISSSPKADPVCGRTDAAHTFSRRRQTPLQDDFQRRGDKSF